MAASVLPPSPYVFDSTNTLPHVVQMALQARIVQRLYLLCYRQNPRLIFEHVPASRTWQGCTEPWVDASVRGRPFARLSDIQQFVDGSTAELGPEFFFLVDKANQRILPVTMARVIIKPSVSSGDLKPNVPSGEVKSNVSSGEVKPNVSSGEVKPNVSSGEVKPSPISTDLPPTDKPRRKYGPRVPAEITETQIGTTKKKHKMVEAPAVPVRPAPAGDPAPEIVLPVAPRRDPMASHRDSMASSGTVVPAASSPLQSVFPSIRTIEQSFAPDPARIANVNQYDQRNEAWLCRQWMAGPAHSNQWTPVGSFYVLFYYVAKILRWPLEEVRVVVDYATNAVPLKDVIRKVYTVHGIEEKWKESSPLLQLLVWCIASMNWYGIVRPLIFVGTPCNNERVKQWCACKQPYNQVLYYITWPFRVDATQFHVLRNGNLKSSDFRATFINDLHGKHQVKKLLKDIPDWVHALARRTQ